MKIIDINKAYNTMYNFVVQHSLRLLEASYALKSYSII